MQRVENDSKMGIWKSEKREMREEQEEMQKMKQIYARVGHFRV